MANVYPLVIQYNFHWDVFNSNVQLLEYMYQNHNCPSQGGHKTIPASCPPFAFGTHIHKGTCRICVVSADMADMASQKNLFYHLVISHSHGGSPLNGGFHRKIIYKWAIFHGYDILC